MGESSSKFSVVEGPQEHVQTLFLGLNEEEKKVIVPGHAPSIVVLLWIVPFILTAPESLEQSIVLMRL